MYKLYEIVGTSNKSFCEATENAVKEFLTEHKHVAWFEVVEQRGAIRKGNKVEFQVKIKLGMEAR